MLLNDVTATLGATSPYEFVTAPQWVRARRGVRIYHNGTRINVRRRKQGYWFVCNKGTRLLRLHLTKEIADAFTINQCDANDLLGIPNVIDKADLKYKPSTDEVSMEETQDLFTEQNVKNMAYVVGMFAVATAVVLGVKTTAQVVTKGRGK